jgi:hypothetical protein
MSEPTTREALVLAVQAIDWLQHALKKMKRDARRAIRNIDEWEAERE